MQLQIRGKALNRLHSCTTNNSMLEKIKLL